MNLVELLVALILLVVGLMVGFCWGVFEGAKRTAEKLRLLGWTLIPPREEE